MGRQVDEMNDLYAIVNTSTSEDAIVYLLEHIAMSLAMIADKIAEEE